jgi:hypothetical protein
MSASQSSKNPRLSRNEKVNSLSREEIDCVVHKICDNYYKPGKTVRKSRQRKMYKGPYLVLYKGKILANPYSFNSSRPSSHPDYSFRPIVSVPRKGESYARMGLHNILWRFYNNYKEISIDMTISHKNDNGYNVSPEDLIEETFQVNASRRACREQGWYLQFKDKDKKYIRCPHDPPCTKRVEIPSDGFFLDKNNCIGFEEIIKAHRDVQTVTI